MYVFLLTNIDFVPVETLCMCLIASCQIDVSICCGVSHCNGRFGCRRLDARQLHLLFPGRTPHGLEICMDTHHDGRNLSRCCTTEWLRQQSVVAMNVFSIPS